MPAPAQLLILATVLPLAGFVLLMFIGKRMGAPLAGMVGTVLIFGSFACSAGATFYWLNGGVNSVGGDWGYGKGPINLPVKWIPVGGGIEQDHPGYLDVGIYVDSLTILMFSMVSGVATLVHVFSLGYMRGDKRFARFFTYLGLFCFSMLGLVISGTTLQLFVFWELVGLCSYLLIGFWYESKAASNAAIKAFVTNRVGDFGFLIGFGILFYQLGNVTLPKMWQLLGTAGGGGAITLPNGVIFSAGLLTFMGIALFFGAVGKSAQFPLHVWLPDAMEGPTPVSALIHAATMVAAGVYLVARLFPILTPDAKLFIAIIGAVTLTMAALIALAQTDIKQVLAFSTISQLGYMMMAIGIGSWVGGMFHLITHAFFKALLFLAAGSVIRAANHEQEMAEFGGLIWKIPMTAITFLIGVLSIAGTPTFAGFYSKDMILQHAAAFGFLAQTLHKSPAYWLFFYLPAGVTYLTAFYMMRCWMLTFWGRPRNARLFARARESAVMYVPLLILALASIFGGKYIGVKEVIVNAEIETNSIVKFDAFKTAWVVTTAENAPSNQFDTDSTVEVPQRGTPSQWLEEGAHKTMNDVHFAWLTGIGLAFLIYINGYWLARPLMRIPPLNWIRTWLYERMYFDELYFSVFVGTTMAFSFLAGVFDKYVVDGVVNLAAKTVRKLSSAAGWNDDYIIDGAANGAAGLAQGLGAAVRAPQTGRIRLYVTLLMIAVTLGLAGAVVVMLSH